MGLHRLLGEEQVLSDLSVHEPVGDELENLELSRSRLLLEVSERRRGRERDHRSRTLRIPARRSRLEAATVVAIPVQDLLPLRGVHALRIGRHGIAL